MSGGKAVLYCRYSSHAQRDVPIDQQVKACRQYAAAQGLEIVHVYADRALSGTSDKRPAFQRMIAEATELDYDYILVYSLDRFARDRYNSAIYKHELKKHGKRVLSVTEHITDDPVGALMEGIFESYNEYYSKELARKCKRGMLDNAEKCLANGKQPYGYRRGADGRAEIVEQEAAVVREIFTRVAAGEAFADIHRSLNARGLKTSTGRPWTDSSFNNMLDNERYTGVYIYSDVRIEGGMPAIIDRDLFDRVQLHLREKKNPRAPQKRRRENGVYLLTGKLYCGGCLSPMVGVSGTGKHGELHYYYVCKGHRSRSGCAVKPFRRDAIEAEIAAALREHVLTDETIVALADAAVAQQTAMRNDPAADLRRASLAEVRRGINNLVAAIEQGVSSPAALQRLSELEREEWELRPLVDADARRTEDTFTREEYIALLKLYQEGDIEDKRYQEALFDAFLIAAYVYGDTLKIKFRLNDRTTTDVSIPLTESSGVRIDPMLGHHIPPIRTPTATITAVDWGVFLLTCSRRQ